MLGQEAENARISLGMSREQLAAETNLTPDVVAAWEMSRVKVPGRVETDLRWRIARKERQEALASSGLEQCASIAAFEREPVPEKLDAVRKYRDRFLEHTESCPVCVAREAYISARFPPMPPAPLVGWLAIVQPIAERIHRLPAWARPAATGASLFVALSLFRLLFLLPAIVRAPGRVLFLAAELILLSCAMGAGLGLLYGGYRALRDRVVGRGSA